MVPLLSYSCVSFVAVRQEHGIYLSSNQGMCQFQLQTNTTLRLLFTPIDSIHLKKKESVLSQAGLHWGISSKNTKPVVLPSSTLLRHSVCLGASGSGKTVACKVLCEEMLLQGVPVIALDPQGDIASMLLPPEASDEGGDETDSSQQEKGLQFQEQVEVVVWTPGSESGIPLSLDPLRLEQLPQQPQERVRTLSTIAAHLSALLGYASDSNDGQFAAAYLDLVLQFLDEHEIQVDGLAGLRDFLHELPEELETQADQLIKPGKREEIGRKLALLSVGARRLLFHLGVPIRIDTLLGLDNTASYDSKTGKRQTRLSVVYLNSLHSQEEKEFFVGQLTQSLYDWMLEHPSPTPQALFYIDEVAPFLPPVRKPACKDTLKLLFKQARKYGVCCLIASQNPGDIDYLALSQFSTWALGRMMVSQDIKKVERILRSLCPEDAGSIADQLPRLEPRQFLLVCPDQFEEVVPMQVRWLYTPHETLDEDRIGSLIPDEQRRRLGVPGSLPKKVVKEPVVEEREEPREETRVELSISKAKVDKPKPAKETKERKKPKPSNPSSESSSIETLVEEAEVDELPRAEDIYPDEAFEVPQELSPPSNHEVVLLQLMQEYPGAYSVKELTHETALTENVVRRNIQRLEERKLVVSVKVGRSRVYWIPEHRFAPTAGVNRPILTAAPRANRERAYQLARKASDTALFGLYRKETVEGPVLEYLPLWRVVVWMERETKKLWRQVKESTEHPVYFHGVTGDLLLHDDVQQFVFVERSVEDGWLKNPLGSEQWMSQVPSRLGYSRRRMQELKSPKAIQSRCKRLLGLPIRHIRLVAIPYWRFSLCRADGTTRPYCVDALSGRPLLLPIT